MAKINLLPWREELRRRRQKEFIVLVVVAVIAMIGVIAGVHLEFNNRIAYQQERNAFLTQQISVLNEKIAQIQNIEQEKSNLLARMEIIEALQSSRPEIVHLFDEIVGTLPEGVYYTEVKQLARNLEVRGMAQSNARVSSLMRNIDSSEWLEKPTLVEIRKLAPKANEPARISEFSLRFIQKVQGEEGGGAS